jgi:hypothetical protein
LVFDLKVVVLADPRYHFEGGRSDGIHLYLAQLFIILSFESRYFFYDLNKVDQKLFELFDAGQSVSLIQLDAIADMLRHGLEVSIVTLDQRAELHIIIVALLGELHGSFVVGYTQKFGADTTFLGFTT